jgi:uncharacterized protein
MDTPTVSDNADQHRYEIRGGGELLGFAEYNRLSNALMFTHTEVLPAHEGHGYSSVLIQAALADVRRQGLHVIPVCKVVAAYMQKHPDQQDLLAPHVRKAFLGA